MPFNCVWLSIQPPRQAFRQCPRPIWPQLSSSQISWREAELSNRRSRPYASKRAWQPITAPEGNRPRSPQLPRCGAAIKGFREQGSDSQVTPVELPLRPYCHPLHVSTPGEVWVCAWTGGPLSPDIPLPSGMQSSAQTIAVPADALNSGVGEEAPKVSMTTKESRKLTWAQVRAAPSRR